MIFYQPTCHLSDLREWEMSEMCKTFIKMDIPKIMSEMVSRR